MEKKLYRSRDKKVIAGIAGGLGEYLDVDPVIIRIILVLITIFHGIGILIYIIMWIAVPEGPYKTYGEKTATSEEPLSEEGKSTSAPPNQNKTVQKEPNSNGRIVVGVILILIGSIFLFERFLPFFDFEFVFSVGLIILGLAMLFNFFNKSEKSS
ncbi:MAG: PspC domain-containing protein [Ignavibacteriales bacterium]|nr:PspC domain-containing protein [Ignavibacteriales bacterium]